MSSQVPDKLLFPSVRHCDMDRLMESWTQGRKEGRWWNDASVVARLCPLHVAMVPNHCGGAPQPVVSAVLIAQAALAATS